MGAKATSSNGLVAMGPLRLLPLPGAALAACRAVRRRGAGADWGRGVHSPADGRNAALVVRVAAAARRAMLQRAAWHAHKTCPIVERASCISMGPTRVLLTAQV